MTTYPDPDSAARLQGLRRKENTPGHRITEVWLFIAVDEDGDEGLPALMGTGGMLIPMVCTDRRRVDDLKATAAQLARQRGMRVELIHFGGGARETLHTWEP